MRQKHLHSPHLKRYYLAKRKAKKHDNDLSRSLQSINTGSRSNAQLRKRKKIMENGEYKTLEEDVKAEGREVINNVKKAGMAAMQKQKQNAAAAVAVLGQANPALTKAITEMRVAKAERAAAALAAAGAAEDGDDEQGSEGGAGGKGKGKGNAAAAAGGNGAERSIDI